MLDLRYTEPAQDDLIGIANYLEQQAGSAIAVNVLRRIRARILSLKRDAHRYRERPELGAGRRALLIGPYIAFYTIIGSTVYVQRILHCARQIKPELFEK
jgi:plasmid stabilization system protein ParE